MTEISHEKRQFPRFPLNSQLTLQVKGTEYKGYTADIGLGGLQLVNIQPELTNTNIGQEGNLLFYKDNEKVEVKCKIQHISSSIIGLSFFET